MTIPVVCPSCGRKLKAPDDVMGRSVKCPNCLTSFIFGSITAEPPPVATVYVPLQEPRPAVVLEPTPADDLKTYPFRKEDSPVTIAGCLLMVVSLVVIGWVAIAVVTWRDPKSGKPMLPMTVMIFVPLLAGALFYAAVAGILKILGIPVTGQPKKKSSDSQRDANMLRPDKKT